MTKVGFQCFSLYAYRKGKNSVKVFVLVLMSEQREGWIVPGMRAARDSGSAVIGLVGAGIRSFTFLLLLLSATYG